jgi:hypothetical protein
MELEFHQLEQKYAGLRIADAHRTARLVASLCERTGSSSRCWWCATPGTMVGSIVTC